MGTVVSNPVSGYLCSIKSSQGWMGIGGWPSVFYVCGGAGCLWFVFWYISNFCCMRYI